LAQEFDARQGSLAHDQGQIRHVHFAADPVTADILDGEALLRGAEAETGLADYGDPTLPDRFRLVAAHLQAAGLDAEGRRAAQRTCHEQLAARLRFFEDRKRHPIAEEVIERPIFATGEPRSGTTLLHALLSLDPNGRALRFWELMYPSPPPGLAAPDDPRRAQADEDWRETLRKIPKWLVNHPYNDMLGDGLPECERAWAFDFRHLGPTVWWRLPMQMHMAGLPLDAHAQYRLHKMVLQHCQYARPMKYWVLKGFHSGKLGALFDIYPDARIIWTHRDPVQVIASRIQMVGELDEGMLGRPQDWKAAAAHYLSLSRASLKAAMASPYLDDPRVHHVRYPDFTADPVGVIRGFYEKAGVAFTPEFETAIRTYLRDNRSDRYGKFRYALDVIGEDIDKLHAEFAPYRERFGLEIEERKSD
jgi:hypothetical protein